MYASSLGFHAERPRGMPAPRVIDVPPVSEPSGVPYARVASVCLCLLLVGAGVGVGVWAAVTGQP